MEKLYSHIAKNGLLFKGGVSTIHSKNEIYFGSLKSDSDDILENQLDMFHVEHNTQADRHLNIIKMKKFKVIWINTIEFLFAPNIQEAQKMFKRLYPGFSAIIEETTI